VRKEHPDVIFLAEAFTRPAMMSTLAKAGFSQSYTYYTWKNAKWEIVQYMRDVLAETDYFRPNFFANTPDILTEQLQHGTRGTYVARLVLAATLSSSYGIYGPAFELMESEPAKPGSEEYLDSEKYQVRHRELGGPDSLDEVITLVNRARREHPALHRTDNLRLHGADNDQLLVYSKATPDCDDVVLVVVNLDGTWRQGATLHLDLEALGIASEDEPYVVHDLLGGATYAWTGSNPYVELDPAILPAHVLHVRTRAHRDEHDFDNY
ncbi:MAG: alpha amylase catalytic region, partial [Thermoleophilia bacterium]|nr:alpha amylase catalytic region [Thermoleophilia bacterium]